MCLLLMLSMAMMLGISQVGVQGPPLEFESHESLEAWAEESIFGGRLYRLGPEALGLHCADRSHTSGVYSSELALYVAVDDSYKLALYLPIKRFVQRKAWIQDETVIIEERSMGQGEGSVEMRVPLRMLSGI